MVTSRASLERRIWSAVLALAVVAVASPAAAQQLGPAELAQRVGIDQKLGASLPPDLRFRDATGRQVQLGDLVGERPLILSLLYYECPMLCGVAMDGLISNLRVVGLELGRDFDVVTVSIDPGEMPAIAAAKKDYYLERLGTDDAAAAAGWHALTGEADSIDALAAAVGFRYVYLPEADEYAHGTAVMLVTTEGKLSHYYYGVSYPARDLRLGLVEASDNRIGSLADQVLLMCYRYDPVSSTYGFAIWSALRVGGVATVLALALFIGISVRRERSATDLPLAATGEGK